MLSRLLKNVLPKLVRFRDYQNVRSVVTNSSYIKKRAIRPIGLFGVKFSFNTSLKCVTTAYNISPNFDTYISVRLHQNYSSKRIHVKEGILTLPNLLTCSRIFCAPFLAYFIINGNYSVTLGLFTLAGVTDLLDGWVARNFSSQSSAFGSFMDPLADKILVGTTVGALVYSAMIPWPLALLIVSRDVILVSAGFYIRYISLPAQSRTFYEYFNATHATSQLKPTFISKVNTVVQLVLIGTTLALPAFSIDAVPFLTFIQYLTAFTTLTSGFSYIMSRNTYQLLIK